MKKQKLKNLKLIAPFIIVMAGCMLIGFLMGFLMKNMEESGVNFEEILHNISINFLYAVPYMFIGLCLLNIVLCIPFYLRSKIKFNSWNGEDENIIEESDKLLAVSMFFSNTAFILNMFLFGAFVTGESYGLFDNISAIRILCFGLFVFMLLFNIVVQGVSVKLVKKMSPEKRGDILSPSFSRDWNNSLDEAEKMIVYKSAYHAFKVTSTACMTLWLILFIGAYTFNTGLLPIATVTIIWLILSCSFQIQGFKLEHHKLNAE